MQSHFLQSDIWTNFQEKLGRKLIKGKGTGWSYVGMVEHDRFGSYIYVPYGPFAKTEADLVAAVEDLKKQAAKIGVYVVNIEPTPPITMDIARKLFRFKGIHRQAHRTLRIDLDGSEDEIIAQMSQTRRKQYRNYSKKGLVFEKSNTKETMDVFFELLRVSSGKKGFYIRDKVFFEKLYDELVLSGNATFFTAKRDGKIEVVALCYEDATTRYYAHVGRDLSDNSLQASAPLLAYMIIDAKRSGKKFFDLYGISESDDKIDEKSGFTVFKKTFGGEIVQFAGAWEIPISKPRYFVKSNLRKAKTIVKKIIK